MPVAAVSCGVYAGQSVLDLDYPEDSEAGVDGNFVMTGGKLVEVQMSAEGSVYTRAQEVNRMADQVWLDSTWALISSISLGLNPTLESPRVWPILTFLLVFILTLEVFY